MSLNLEKLRLTTKEIVCSAKEGFITMSQFCCFSGFCILKLDCNICLINKLTVVSGMHIDNKAYSYKDSLQYPYTHKIVVRQLL